MQRHFLSLSHGQQSIEIPYLVFGENNSGPHVFISGGIHGDEVNGIALVEKFLQWAETENIESQLQGKVTVLPLLNPPGFLRASRYFDEQKTDLNRQFGVSQPTTLAEIIASELTEKIFKHCQIGIDCHDAGNKSSLLPHVRIHKDDLDGCISCSREVGQIFGTKFLLERTGHSQMMAIALKRNHNVPVITVEMGGAKIIHEKFLEQGLQGIKNVFFHLGLLTGEPLVPEKQYVLFDRFGYTAPKAGVVHFTKNLGDSVLAEETVGHFFDPLAGTSEPLVSHSAGIIFSRWEFNQVSPGDVLFSVLQEEKSPEDNTEHQHLLKPIVLNS